MKTTSNISAEEAIKGITDPKQAHEMLITNGYINFNENELFVHEKQKDPNDGVRISADDVAQNLEDLGILYKYPESISQLIDVAQPRFQRAKGLLVDLFESLKVINASVMKPINDLCMKQEEVKKNIRSWVKKNFPNTDAEAQSEWIGDEFEKLLQSFSFEGTKYTVWDERRLVENRQMKLRQLSFANQRSIKEQIKNQDSVEDWCGWELACALITIPKEREKKENLTIQEMAEMWSNDNHLIVKAPKMNKKGITPVVWNLFQAVWQASLAKKEAHSLNKLPNPFILLHRLMTEAWYGKPQVRRMRDGVIISAVMNMF